MQHDWNDQDAMKILRNIRQRAAQAAVTVLLVEVRVRGQKGGVGLWS